jgi:hypothetical protein
MKRIQNAKYNNDKSKLLVEFYELGEFVNKSKDEFDVVDNSIAFENRKYFIIDEDNQKEQIEKRLKTGDFRNCIFLVEVQFQFQKFKKDTFFIRTIFMKNIIFSHSIFLENVNFRFAEFKQQAIFIVTTFLKESNFENIMFLKYVTFTRSVFCEDLYFRGSVFKNIAIFGGVNCNKSIDFDSITINENISFELAKIKETLSFANVKFEDSAKKYINLNLKFTQVERIEYGNAKFRADNRETFLTLKNVALKQNDKIKALDFHKQEYETHYQNLNWKQFDKWILGFENSISKFGTSVVDSVCWFVIATIFFYMLMLISTNTIADMSNFIMFFSPTNYKVDTIFNTINWFSGGVFLTYKILQLVLIYEIIKSFRKFSRNL